MRHRLLAVAPAAVTVFFGAAAMYAGPLSPPAGPVAPTPGPEPRVAINLVNTPDDADSLYRIAQPGSYYLTGNITGVAGKHGVEIASSGVSLDLNGFDLAGVPGSLDGVSASVLFLTNIAVFNGSVRNWGEGGIDLISTGGLNCRVHDVSASGNGADGVSVSVNCIVTHCAAYANAANGFYGVNGCVFAECVAAKNGEAGFRVASGGTSNSCCAESNTGSGITIESAGSILDCTCRFNSLDGITCSSACFIRGNTCHNNGNGPSVGAGIHATGISNRIEGNRCAVCDYGIKADDINNYIARNTCSGNSTNWSIVAGNACLVVQGVTGGAINGGSGGAAPGSTDPNANFSH